MKKLLFVIALLFSRPALADEEIHKYVQYDCATGEISGEVYGTKEPDVSKVADRCQMETKPEDSTINKKIDPDTKELIAAPPEKPVE